MSNSGKDHLILQPAFIFSYVGLLGYLIFFLLRPSIDFTSGISISQTVTEVQEAAQLINERLGFNSENYPVIANRFYDRALFDRIRENQQAGITPHALNRSGVPISGWRISVGEKYSEPAIIQTDQKIFNDVGIVQYRFGEDGRVSHMRTKEENNPFFVESGTSYSEITSLISEVFEYSLMNYILEDPEPGQLQPETDFEPDTMAENELLPSEGKVTFRKVNQALPGPEFIELEYKTITAPIEESDDLIEGLQLSHFTAGYISEDSGGSQPGSSETFIWNAFFLILFLILLSIIVFVTGIRQVFRGRVEWKRSLIILVTVTLVHYTWTVGYFYFGFYNFLSSSIVYMDLLQQFFLAALYGVYAAVAYIAWESLARELKSEQIPVIDAVWSGKFFQKEVGVGILSGFGIAGFYLGILAVFMYSFGGFFVPIESITLGYRELATPLPFLHIMLNSWSSSILIVLAQVGVIYCLIASFTKKHVIRLTGSILFTGLSLYGISQFFISDVSEVRTLIIYIILAVPLVLSYRYFGLISAFVSWFVLLAVMYSLPMMGTENPALITNLWLTGAIVLVPFVIGLVGLRGKSLKSYQMYVPEYEEQRNKQLRSEKELAIAKESQYALMPAAAPTVPGLDIRGFFVPSYEVGGDFYDYVVIQDSQGKPEAVAAAIVDVSGKAMKSAFNAVFTSGLLLSRISSDAPEKILTEINPILCRKTDVKTFVTCQIGHIELKTKKLTLANAGHCKPLLKRNGMTTFLETAAPRFPLGMKTDVRYKAVEANLQKGDVLLLYSDGLAEAVNQAGERLSFNDILQLVNELDTGDLTSEQICVKLKKFILEYSDYELVDDTTVVCIKVTD